MLEHGLFFSSPPQSEFEHLLLMQTGMPWELLADACGGSLTVLELDANKLTVGTQSVCHRNCCYHSIDYWKQPEWFPRCVSCNI
jgi:hypothetical protein